MKSKVVFAVLMAALCSAAAAASRTATEAYVTNRVTQAAIAATNYTDAAIAALPAPDYSPTNAELRATIEAVAPAPGDYAAVSNAAMTARAYADQTFLPLSGGSLTGSISFPYFDNFGVYIGPQHPGALVFGSSYPDYAQRQAILDLDRIPDGPTDIAYLSEVSAAATAATNYTDEAIASLAPPEVDLTDYATHDDATNAARAVSAPLEENVGVLWQFVFADSVWLAVTNYMRTVEGVSPSLQLWEVRDGATNCVYSSREEITNFVNVATAALRTEITNAMPDKAWSKYQSATGAENPQPGAITIVSTPQVMLTGGGEWNRYVNTGGSAVWVLHSNGLTTFGGGVDGTFFAVQDDEGNKQFEVSRTDSYEVDALADSCGWDEGGGSGNFQVTFNAPASGNQPVLYASTNLTESFTAEENGQINALGITVNWGASGGLWRATIVQDATVPALFVHAKVLQEGSVIVKHNAPTSLDGGLFLNNVKYRIVPATISGKTVLTLEVAP